MPTFQPIEHIAAALSLSESEKERFAALCRGESWRIGDATPSLLLLTQPSSGGGRVVRERVAAFLSHPKHAPQLPWALSYPGMDLGGLPVLSEDCEALSQLIRLAQQRPEPAFLCLHGPNGSGRSILLQYTACQMGLSVLFADCFPDGEEWEKLKLECLLMGAAVCFRNCTIDHPDRLKELLHRMYPAVSLVFFTGEQPLPDRESGCYTINHPMPVPSPEQRDRIWQKLSADYPLSDELKTLSVSLTPGQMQQALHSAYAQTLTAGEETVSFACFVASCQKIFAQSIAGFGQIVPPVFGWEELILPQEQQTRLQDIQDRIRHSVTVYERWGFGEKMPYGTGVKLLLTGPPGTGKTMAAIVLAGAVGLPLLKVDTGAIMSKYIGETEKNLGRVFEAAAQTNCILLFDEADSLFGKRSEVKDSHDRYANLQTSFLLQKIEEYPGTVLLTTNFQQNFDEAFRRRFHYILPFSLPAPQERKRLWDTVFPSKTPLSDDIDTEYLAETFALSGGSIKNIALTAAFFAAAQDTAVGMKHIVKALREECDKMGSPVSENVLAYFETER